MDYYAVTLFLYILPKIRDCQSKCSDGFPHGKPTWSKWWCTPDSMCPYSCDEGYEKTDPDSDLIYCNIYGEWKTSIGGLGEDPCKPKSCLSQIPNGGLSTPLICPATVGTTCEYSCYVGYQKNIWISSIACLPSTKWSSNLHSLCTNQQQCSYEVDYGDLELSCRRMPGETCKFTCRENYIPSTMVPSTEITCGESRNWSQPLSSLCRPVTTTTTTAPILCPKTFSNGYISYWCDRVPPSKCSYNCNSGCYKNYSALDCSKYGYCSLRCSIHGYWRDEKYACICEHGEDPDTPDQSAYVVGICVGVAFPVAITLVCFGICCKRLNRDRGCNNTVSRRGQTSLQQPSHAERVVHRPPAQPPPRLLAPWAGQPQSADNTPTADGPPEYNSVATTIPGDVPPSYEQVICNPSKFKM